MTNEPARRVLVTGASGFIGMHLVPFLAANGYAVRAAARSPESIVGHAAVERVSMPDLLERADWRPLVDGVTHVVHLAGIAHRKATDAEHDRGNHQAAGEIADAAAQAGVRQFIFVSSVAAQCGPVSDAVLRETDAVAPVSAYGHAKLAGEARVRQSGVPFTILRPTVVEGKGAKGNFALVERVAALPIPLPFERLGNRRSVLSIGNFMRAVTTVMDHDAAFSETYLVADPDPPRTSDIFRRIRSRQKRPAWLFGVSPALLGGIAAIAGQRAMWERLSGSLVVDPGKLLALGWSPAPDDD